MFLTPRRYARPAGEIAVLARGEAVLLPSAHGDLAAWVWGPREEPRDLVESLRASDLASDTERPSVLLVHGWEGRGSQLGAFVEPLTAAGFRVVAFDGPGHGDSPGARSSLFHIAGAVTRAAEVLGPFHAIIAHSMGGASTLWASRLGPLAERVALIAPPVDLRDYTRAMSRVMGWPEEVRGRLHARLGARFGVPIEEVRAERLASAMRGPMLVVHDEDDREVPIACGEAIARAWPGAALVRTRGLGHRRILRDAATIEAIVRFVAMP